MAYSDNKHNLDDEDRGNPITDACRQSHGDRRVKMHYVHPIDDRAKILKEQR